MNAFAPNFSYFFSKILLRIANFSTQLCIYSICLYAVQFILYCILDKLVKYSIALYCIYPSGNEYKLLCKHGADYPLPSERIDFILFVGSDIFNLTKQTQSSRIVSTSAQHTTFTLPFSDKIGLGTSSNHLRSGIYHG